VTPPAAATVAARRRSTGARTARSGRAAAARPPRRVSGPLRAPVASAAAAVALPQPLPRRQAPPRRRPAAVPRPARRPDLPLGARALDWLRALPEHRLLDRLIGGRVWIVLLGTLLVGIVTLQLTLLRLNAGIGRAIEQSSALQQSNASLRLELSQLSDADRVMALASQMGYVMPPQGSPRFLTASPGDAARALVTMRVPDPSAASIAPSATSGATSAAPVTATTPTTAGTTTGTTAPAATQTMQTQGASGATTGTTGATVPAAATQAPAAAAPAAAAGGASAPVGGQG